MYLIVGLGNPGSEFENTRHNLGFRVIESWVSKLGVNLIESDLCKVAFVELGGKKVILQCPLTFMNLSGKAVRAYKDCYDIKTENILVIHDDLDLPLGRLRLARNGGSGGHKGVQSIIEELGSQDFPRLRIGIGRPRYGERIEDFVLSPFYKDQRKTIEKVIPIAIEGCELFVSNGIDYAMNKINGIKIK